MDVKVHFRFNKRSGEIERFEIDQDSTLPSVEHEREHDRVAAEIGALLERLPRVMEVLPGAAAAERADSEAPAETDQEQEAPARQQPERERQR